MGDTSDESNTNDDELYMYTGCYDNTIKKLLSDGPHKRNKMSAEVCYKICKEGANRNRFNYFGTQNGGDCFCGKFSDIEFYKTHGYKRDKSECKSICRANDDENCGSKYNASLYKLKGIATTTTTTTNGLPTNTANNVTLAAAVPIIVVSALAFLLVASVLVTIIVCYRRKKARNSQPFEIQQNQIIAEINDSSECTEGMNNAMTNVGIIKIKEDKVENKTSHHKTPVVAASFEQDNKYESLSTNRNSIEHTYESDSIQANQYESLTKQGESDSHTYASTEHAISQNIKTSIDLEDEVCNKYESLSAKRNSVEHTYESDSIHANQYESLTHKPELEEHTYDSPELASHTSTASDVNQYQSLTMPQESDTHVYASTLPYSNEI